MMLRLQRIPGNGNGRTSLLAFDPILSEFPSVSGKEFMAENNLI
jgi:hypothetical protein